MDHMFELPSYSSPARPLETRALNPKHKREVCRYWIKGICVKGAACEFLHVWDNARMPECSHGDLCRDSSCLFRHTQRKFVCMNYEQGFCAHGRLCPHQHIQKEGPPPMVASYWTTDYKPRSEDTPTFRIKKCSYFLSNGWCPYFDMCAFRHED